MDSFRGMPDVLLSVKVELLVPLLVRKRALFSSESSLCSFGSSMPYFFK